MSNPLVKMDETTPLLLRKMEKMSEAPMLATASQGGHDPVASHFTVVTTGGQQVEMHDQQEDR